MLVLIVLLHGAGLDGIVTLCKKRAEMMSTRKGKRHPRFATYIFAGTILLILMLHIPEACIWGTVLHKVGLVENLHDSICFSANPYTTIKIRANDSSFRLARTESRHGFIFAWTTGEMFNIAQHQHQLLADLSDHRKNTRRSKQKSPSPEVASKQDDRTNRSPT